MRKHKAAETNRTDDDDDNTTLSRGRHIIEERHAPTNSLRLVGLGYLVILLLMTTKLCPFQPSSSFCTVLIPNIKLQYSPVDKDEYFPVIFFIMENVLFYDDTGENGVHAHCCLGIASLLKNMF